MTHTNVLEYIKILLYHTIECYYNVIEVKKVIFVSPWKALTLVDHATTRAPVNFSLYED